MAAKNFLELHTVKVTFDGASTDSAGVSNLTQTAHPTGVFIPDNAIIINAFFEVETAFTSAASTATIAIHVESASDVVTAVAINSGTTYWDAGIHSTKVGQWAADGNAQTAIAIAALKAASYIKVDGTEEVTFTVGTQALLTGKLHLYLQYIMGV